MMKYLRGSVFQFMITCSPENSWSKVVVADGMQAVIDLLEACFAASGPSTGPSYFVQLFLFLLLVNLIVTCFVQAAPGALNFK